MNDKTVSPQDSVVAFVVSEHSADGCFRERKFVVRGQSISALPTRDWSPKAPVASLSSATLITHYSSGRKLEVDIEGGEFEELQNQGRLHKMLSKISKGQTPGEALKRQLTKALDLLPLPNVTKKKLKVK